MVGVIIFGFSSGLDELNGDTTLVSITFSATTFTGATFSAATNTGAATLGTPGVLGSTLSVLVRT